MRPGRRGGAGAGRHPSRTGLTSRAAVLALVLCALVVMLADPLQQYLGQRSQIAKQHSTNTALQRRVDALAAQERMWSDPSYVRQQARERLYFVMPGETPYVVVGGPASPAARPPAPGADHPTVAVAARAGSWYDRLWSSVEQAGRPAAAAPAPAGPARPAPIRPGGGG